MKKTFIVFRKEDSPSGPELVPDEKVLWRGQVDRIAFLLYWLPRAGLILAFWTSGWVFAASKNGPLFPLNVKAAIPHLSALLGFIGIAAFPIFCLLARRYLYLITTLRVVTFDTMRTRSFSVYFADITGFDILSSYQPGVGTIRLETGTVRGAESPILEVVPVVGATNVRQAEQILHERMQGHGIALTRTRGSASRRG